VTTLGAGAKFSTTTSGHTHPNTPRVFYGPTPPTEGMQRGDIWVETTAARSADAK